MKWNFFFEVLLIVNCIDKIVTSNVFTIIGPKMLRKGEAYKCTVTTHNFKGSASFNVTLSGISSTNSDFLSLSQVVEVSSDESQSINFHTENFPMGAYSISVVDLKNLNFIGDMNLVYQPKSFSLFIQTDKAIYKADDVIRFRVFAINSQSLPYSVKGFPEVTISDPSNNKIKQFTNVTFTKGKFEGELLLSSSPKTGSWSIKVDAEGEVISKSIEVQEYSLPAFSASVSAPKRIAFADGHIPITVGAQYTFGQKVEGSAVVTFKQFGYQIVHERSVIINASSITFDVDLEKDLKIEQISYDQSILVQIDFTDKQTAQLATASTEFEIVQFRHQIVFKGASNFKPGLLYVFKVTVKKLDGSPVAANSKILIQSIFNGGIPLNQTFFSDHTGSVDLDTEVPINATSLEIITSFADAKLSSYVYPTSSYQKEFLSIDVLTIDPILYSDIDIDIYSTENVKSVNVVMISKGIVVLTEKVKMKKNVGSLTFNPKFDFAPKTDIIAYYVNDANEIVSDSTSLSLRDRLPNYLNLAIFPTICKPGENVQISVSSTIQSTVSLLAIDQRVLLLKSGNDLTLYDIFGNLDLYNDAFESGGEILFDRPLFKRPWIWYEDYTSKFEKVNLLIISNALDNFPVHKFPDYDYAVFQPFPGKPEENIVSTPGPDEVSNGASGISKLSKPKVRKDFSESFLWQDVEILKLERARQNKNRGREVVNVKVPESITSYIVSGVSMNSRFGLALPLSLPSLTVFQPFFLQVTFPFSIKRGEKLKLDIFVFNFLSNSQTVTVSIEKNEVEFNLQNPETNGWTTESQRYLQTFNSSPDSTQKLTIYLIAKVLGFVTLKITAIGSLAGDAIEQKLRVVPEGIPRFISNSTIIVKSSAEGSVKAELSCLLPQTAVNDTIKISASVAGDILGSTLNNLEKLIQKPSGCGEQNMLNFVPNIVILRYLEATNKLTAAIKTKTVHFTEIGYQKELEYLRSDGSFSAFGKSDPFGSSWLTGYVVKSFILARPYIAVDLQILESSLNFLISKQNLDGSFREDGRVIHTDMQGGSSSGIPLTAYLAIVLTECLPHFPQYQAQRDNALNFVVANYNATDVYALGILSYALSFANHSSYQVIFNKFYALAIETADELHWEKKKEVELNPYWYQAPSSLDVEISSYALLALYKKDISKSLKLIRWIVKQQNSIGGFQSTQDTVVALDALASFATLFTLTTSDLNLVVTPNAGSSFSASVNHANALVLQSFDLLQSVRNLNVLTSGTGLAIVSLSCSYYEVIENQKPRFKIEHHFVDPCYGFLKSSICVSYITQNSNEVSNMVLLTFKLPSGFIYEERKILNSVISKIEASQGGTEIDVYINSLSEKTFCFYIDAIQAFSVEELKGGSIEVIDYYDTSKKAALVYSVPKLLPCQPKTPIDPPHSANPSEYFDVQ